MNYVLVPKAVFEAKKYLTVLTYELGPNAVFEAKKVAWGIGSIFLYA